MYLNFKIKFLAFEMSKGSETEKLKKNLRDQLKRLISQLNDIEETKDDLGDEYFSMKEDTLEQLEEFRCALDQMEDGKMSLLDEISKMQLMIQVIFSHER